MGRSFRTAVELYRVWMAELVPPLFAFSRMLQLGYKSLYHKTHRG